ncbi:MAG: insulinase family protein [Asticcacaulis sp.]
MKKLFMACALVLCAVPMAGQAQNSAPKPLWPYESSDLQRDATAVYGRLPNGMTYVIYQSYAVLQPISMRFRIRAGSLNERPGEEGYAHFVEHMAFNGSTNLPKSKFQALLDEHGFTYGFDINGGTSHKSTDYTLNLPGYSEEVIKAGLLIFRETASNLTFDPSEVRRELPIVLSEERMYATQSAQATEAWDRAVYAGMLYPERSPIGRPATLNSATAESLKRFYTNWYRPENATLVIVGLFDPKLVEGHIQRVFSDWKNPTPAPAEPVLGTYKASEPRAHVYANKNLAEELSVNWLKPYTPGPDNRSTRRDDFLTVLAIDILNQRLSGAAQVPNAPFREASLSRVANRITLDRTTLTISPAAGQTQGALAAAMKILTQYRLHGATQDELERSLARLDAAYQREVRSKKTPVLHSLARELADTVDEKTVFDSVDQRVALWTELKPGLTLADVNARTALLFKGDGPVLTRAGGSESGADAEVLLAVYEAAAKAESGAYAETKPVSWMYSHFGTPVKRQSYLVSRRHDYTYVRYPNGVTANLKKSILDKDKILIRIRFDGGLRLFAPDEKAPLFGTWTYDPLRNGLGKMSYGDIKRALPDQDVSFNYSIEEDATYLEARTDRSGFPYQMLAMMAWLTDRVNDKAVLKASINDLHSVVKSAGTDSEDLLNFYLMPLLTCGDNRYAVPDKEAIASLTPEKLTALIDRTVSNTPIDITIVGDIAESSAEALIERTFATLPQQPAPPVPAKNADRLVMPSKANVWRLYHQGRDDQAEVMIVFPTTGVMPGFKRARTVELLGEVLDKRVHDELREKRGLTYDAHAASYASTTFDDFGYLYIRAEINPKDETAFREGVAEIVRDLQSKPLSGDVLKPIRDQLAWSYNDLVKSHHDWGQMLPGLSGSKRADYEFRVSYLIDSLSANDVMTAARTYLVPDRMQYFIALPEKPGQTEPVRPSCPAN